MTVRGFEAEMRARERFEFGKNWARFLAVLSEERILEAERSLRAMLGVETLAGLNFLDVGCGSGLFSLAALRLGAARVHSFDYDPRSVGCAQELRRRFFPGAAAWTVERGSVLDAAYLGRLGQWDIVYSWGVLHHTGAMWRALANVIPLVQNGGTLFISIYNDQGGASRRWRRLKALYNRYSVVRGPLAVLVTGYFGLKGLAVDVLRRQNPLTRYTQYQQSRGMSVVYNMIDWLGGYPFEVARPDEIFDFYRRRGFTLDRLTTWGGGHGCNEYVFHKG